MRCIVCGKRVLRESKFSIFLYLTPRGEAWVCGKKCQEKYNHGDSE
jgi:hypothetical protein